MKSGKLLVPAKINAVAAGDLQVIEEFDRAGLPPAPGEKAAEFAARLNKLQQALMQLDKDLHKKRFFEPAAGIKLSLQAVIPAAIRAEALDKVQNLYDVRPDWVPGFFANERFGALWGGCALSDPESNLVLFIIRSAFRKKRKFLVYDRVELMAHEMTHAAHQAFDEWQFEEYFAYRTAPSPLRRFFGGCFIQKYDAMFFLLPILLLPLMQFLNLLGWVQLPMAIFWVLAVLYPLFLVIRCVGIARRAALARKFLQQQKIARPEAVLFRLTAAEIKSLAGGTMPEGDDLRWKILAKYFDNKEL